MGNDRLKVSEEKQMFSLFFISLGIGLIAAYLYRYASEEIPRIMVVGILAICCAIALVVAPWFIQLSILTFVLYSTRNFSLPQKENWG